jgi:hypothetical protein
MAQLGFFAVDRSIWDHHLLRRQRFNEHAAFLWLLSSASYAARRVVVGSQSVELERGQLAHSSRYLASIWQWPEATVRRFLKRLQNGAAIDVDSNAGVTRITICNYDGYQRLSKGQARSDDASSDAGATQQRRKIENKKTREDSSETTSLRNRRAARSSKRDDRQRLLAAFEGVLFNDRATAVVEHRLLLGKPLTLHAALLLARSFSGAADPNAAADEMIERGWLSWELEWSRNSAKSNWRSDRSSLVDGFDELERMLSRDA